MSDILRFEILTKRELTTSLVLNTGPRFQAVRIQMKQVSLVDFKIGQNSKNLRRWQI